jgi:hypothetical protein
MLATPRNDVRRDQHEPAVDSIDVDTGDRENSTAGTRNERISRLTAVFGLFVGDDDRQTEQDHVAADLGRGLRQPEAEERSVPEDGERALA